MRQSRLPVAASCIADKTSQGTP